jgi:hypothetical protein
MSFYQRHIVPRLTHLAMRQTYFVPYRKRVVGAAGDGCWRSASAPG